VTRVSTSLTGILAAIWGASFLFIKVGDRGFAPTTMMAARLAVAAIVLLGYLATRGELAALRRAPLGAFGLGLVNAAIPYTLIGWGEKHVDSGTAAVVNSGVPLFVALLAPWLAAGERVGGIRLAGLVVGFGGVAWLVGLHPHGGGGFVAGTAAILLATVSYAFGALYGRHLVERTSGPVLATAAYAGAALVLLPVGIVQAPHRWPGWEPVGSVLALALLGTALAQVLWFRLLVRVGSVGSTLVSYLLPAVALFYGAVFLGEPVGIAKLGGFALILAGVVLASGAALRARAQAAA
jgi:drug/metabolite transporter (DMT)-like permease